MPYSLLYGERSVASVTNNTRADGRAFLEEAALANVRVHARPFSFASLHEALCAVQNSHVDGAAVIEMF
jgi:propanol-preferring alcohol dehydrogenase